MDLVKKRHSVSKRNTPPGKHGINEQLPAQVRKQLNKHYVNKYGVGKKG